MKTGIRRETAPSPSSRCSAVRAVLADRAAASAHTSSVRLVRVAMELQGELDAQEDHDRWTLQLHLLLECAAMP